MSEFYHPGDYIAGRYFVTKVLIGGMGLVYLCADLGEEGRPVVLKTFRPEYLPNREARDRFLREGTTWVKLGRHPHIVRAYRVERIGDGREVYLVLELIAAAEGKRDASLRAWLTPGTPLAIEQALLFALHVARGMKHATTRILALIHRDLKPENVLVGRDGNARVADFGLVKVVGESGAVLPFGEEVDNVNLGQVQFTRGAGTPLYMAPEQWTGGPLNMRADMYAFGCILYEMLMGKYAVAGRSVYQLEQAHLTGQASQGKLPEEWPDMLRMLVRQCLAVKPNSRPTSWTEVEAAVASAYEVVTSKDAPVEAASEEETRAQRVAAGWSYNYLGFSYMDISKPEVAMEYFEHVIGIAEAESDLRLKAAGLTHLGLACAGLGDARRAVGYHEQALAAAREIGDQRGEGDVLGNLGLAYARIGDAQRAIECHKQALTITRQIGNRDGEAGELINLGECHATLGNFRYAIELCEEGLRIAREIGNRHWEGNALGALGNAYQTLGDLQRAIECIEQAVTIHQQIGDRDAEAGGLINLGVCYNNLGDFRQAIKLLGEGLRVAREVGNRQWEANALDNLGTAYREIENVQQAIEYHKQSLVIRREIGDRRGEGAALGNLGSAYYALGEVQRAIGFHEQALEILREIGDQRGEGAVLGNLGNAYSNLGDARQAIEYWQEASAILEEIGDMMGAVATSFNLALLLVQQGRPAEALPYAERATQVFAQIGHVQYAQRAQQLVTQLRAMMR